MAEVVTESGASSDDFQRPWFLGEEKMHMAFHLIYAWKPKILDLGG